MHAGADGLPVFSTASGHHLQLGCHLKKGDFNMEAECVDKPPPDISDRASSITKMKQYA